MKNLAFQLIDLTQTLHSDVPTWHGGCGFNHQRDLDYDLKETYQFRTHTINMVEGIGTHLDAPAHCIKGARSIADIDVNELVSPCVVLNVSQNCHERYSVSVDDLLAFEEKYGSIQPNSFVIAWTGWDKYWPTPEKYRNNLIFPSFSIEAAIFLLEQRNIAGLGIDTLSPDRPEDGYPVHQAVLSKDKYIIENIANAGNLPPTGSYSLALPLKIKNGTESPMRFVALLFS